MAVFNYETALFANSAVMDFGSEFFSSAIASTQLILLRSLWISLIRLQTQQVLQGTVFLPYYENQEKPLLLQLNTLFPEVQTYLAGIK